VTRLLPKSLQKNWESPRFPVHDGEVMDLDFARSEAERIGFPLIIKAAAGGGGRGMKVVSDKKDLEEAFNTARREAQMAFGNGAVYMERYLQKPRHIEIQVIGDGLGSGLHLGERDCSLQRRHQKILEEAPSVCLNNNQRDEIGAICAKAIGELKYRGVGTIEFLYEDGSFFFIEMNTRLQVEHPVTEAIFNIDLVKEQIRIAAGLGISFTQDELTMTGHAIECRINAEDPFNLTPSPGHVDGFHPAGGYGVRVDSALFSGYDVPPYYDSLIAKLIVHGKSRNECLLRLNRCLHEFVVSGISTNIALFDEILKDQDFQNGQYDIHWLTKFLEERGVRLS
jgi:Biotin carboxylase